MKLLVINGSVREGRMSDSLEAWVQEVLEQDKELEIDMADLAKVDLPFYNEPGVPSMPGFTYKDPRGAAWAKRVEQADAFLFITPEYNHGPTAVQKNALDWVFEGWKFKPAGFVSYGGAAAGTRAVQQLKQNLVHLDVFPVHNNVHLPIWGGALDENGRPQASYDETLHKVIVDLKTLAARLSD